MPLTIYHLNHYHCTQEYETSKLRQGLFKRKSAVHLRSAAREHVPSANVVRQTTFFTRHPALPVCADMLYTRLRRAIAIAIDFSEEICGAPDASFVVCVACIGWLAT